MIQGLGNEWTITPAGGSTGDAYSAQHNEKRLFLKRNSSPFIAVLSAEGIVPKLVWTKRLENGDVITAQKWLEGRALTAREMKLERVAHLLSKIHHSTELLDLFMRMGKKPLEPETIFIQLKNKYQNNSEFANIDYHKALKFLNKYMHAVLGQRKVVCHCDVNHNNWMLGTDDHLYLIDWDNAVISDPAADIGMILHLYIPISEWDNWLETYGIKKDEQLMTRIYWYVLAQALHFIYWHTERKEEKQLLFWQKILHETLNHTAIIY
ncbi:phosphotransferase family protein [Salirhabdus sp. Marseille-P4669]|uniref:phosphotransferase family protein n=1 Tax=Salirhabdus sp. Marseille-P4669 TaxID=2042310 RepID=UPI000C7C53B3|nr:phosphotransferase family protein [Salirhabdus sp. Marseille-P4669]